MFGPFVPSDVRRAAMELKKRPLPSSFVVAPLYSFFRLYGMKTAFTPGTPSRSTTV